MLKQANRYNKISFENIEESTLKLIEILPKERMRKDEWIVVSISTQGVPVANMIAEKFNLDFDLLFSEPICTPNNKNCRIGMVSETEEIVLNTKLVDSFEINLDFIYGEAHRKYEEKILPKVYQYRKGDLISSLSEKNILLVDEGCETGISVMVATKTAISAGAKSIAYATPLIPIDIHEALETVIDEIFSVHKVSSFVEVDFYYENLKALEADDILDIITKSKNYIPSQKKGE